MRKALWLALVVSGWMGLTLLAVYQLYLLLIWFLPSRASVAVAYWVGLHLLRKDFTFGGPDIPWSWQILGVMPATGIIVCWVAVGWTLVRLRQRSRERPRSAMQVTRLRRVALVWGLAGLVFVSMDVVKALPNDLAFGWVYALEGILCGFLLLAGPAFLSGCLSASLVRRR